MKQISTTNAEHTKAFCDNHKERNILLVSSNKNTGVVFEAELTLDEFKAVCDFITANFKNDGRR